MFNLYQLTTFVTVIAEGSMTAAADKLYLTQPAVSQQIRNLEEDLGVNLLVRGVRQIKPTLQGQLLYDYAKKILAAVQQAEISIKTLSAELTGHFRIGTLNSIGLHMISPIVGRLLKHNPNLSLVLDYNNGEDLIRSFNKKKLDILILPKVEQEYGVQLEDVSERFFKKDEMWLVASSRDSSMPRQITLEEYASKPVVMLGGEYPAFSRMMAEKVSAKSLVFQPVFESSNVGTLKRVIEGGIGWGFVPSHCITKQIRSNRLTRIHVQDLSYEIDFTYYLRKDLEDRAITEVLFQSMATSDRNS